MQKNQKNKLIPITSHLNKHLNSYLSEFLAHKQWSDFDPWLKKILTLLKEYPSPYIIQKLLLSKRLSQSLNPILPQHVHSIVLDIYTMIFKNMLDSTQNNMHDYGKFFLQDIGIWAVGLFPFFQWAAPKNKIKMLELFTNYFLQHCIYSLLENQLIPMLPGLLEIIVPQMSSTVGKEVQYFLLKLCKQTDRKSLICVLWILILRSSNHRIPSLKLLMKMIPRIKKEENKESDGYEIYQDDMLEFQDQNRIPISRTPQPEANDDQDQHKKSFHTLPEGVSLVSPNSEFKPPQGFKVIQVIQNIKPQTKQLLVLWQIEQVESNWPKKQTLVYQALQQCVSDQNKLVKRVTLEFINGWIGIKRVFDQNYTVKLIGEVLKLLVKRDLSLQRRINDWLFGSPNYQNIYELPQQTKQVLFHGFRILLRQGHQNTMKILQSFFIQHPHMLAEILPNLMIDVMRYSYEGDQSKLKHTQRFFEGVTSCYEGIFTVLGCQMIENPNQNHSFEVVKYMQFGYKKLINKQCDGSAKYLTSIIYYICKRLQMSKCNISTLCSLILMHNILNKLLSVNRQDVKLEVYKEIMVMFSSFYAMLTQDMQEDYLQEQYVFATGLVVRLASLSKSNKQQWFNYIQRGIIMDNPIIAIASIEGIIQILVNQDKCFLQLKDRLIVEDKSSASRQALQKLWALLDHQPLQQKIYKLIDSFNKYFPDFFKEVISKSFATAHVANKQAAVRRFVYFWRMDKKGDIVKLGISKVLSCLDDQNPLVSHAAKQWIQQALPQLSTILDLLLQDLCISSKYIYISDSGQHIVNRCINLEQLSCHLYKFRLLLNRLPSGFLRYIYSTYLTQNMQNIGEATGLKRRVFGQNQKKHEQHIRKQIPKELYQIQIMHQHIKFTYIDLIVYICITYLELYTPETLSIKLYLANQKTLSSSSQFLQCLLSNLQTPELLIKLVTYIIPSIFKVFAQAIINDQGVTQVHMLSLIRCIVFGNVRKGKVEDVRKIIGDILQHQMLIPKILQSLEHPTAYLRSQYISFISNIIPLMGDLLSSHQSCHQIRSILFAYYQIIKKQELHLLNRRDKIEEVQQMSKIEKTKRKYRKKKDKNYVGAQIFPILVGIKNILNHFLDLNLINYQSIQYNIQTHWSFKSTMKSILTLGIASSTNKQYLDYQTKFYHHLQICQSIQQDLLPVVQSVVTGWQLNKTMQRIRMDTKGIDRFEYTEFGTYNQNLLQLINYLQQQPQSLMGHLSSLLRPLLFKFPKRMAEIYLHLWIKTLQQQQKQIELLKKIIQSLVGMAFPMEIFSLALQDTFAFQKLYKHYEQKKKNDLLDFEIGVLETRVIYFLYCYFYFESQKSNLQQQSLQIIYTNWITLISVFEQSKHPNTILWILQFLLMMTNKYSIQKLLYQQKYKAYLHKLVNRLVAHIAKIATAKLTIEYQIPKIGFKQQAEHFKAPQLSIIYPITASIHTKTSKEDLKNSYRQFCIDFLCNCSLQVYQNVYRVDHCERMAERIFEWMQDVFAGIEDKKQEYWSQRMTQILWELLHKGRGLILRHFKTNILYIFNKDDFFNCSLQSIKVWCKISNHFINNQLFKEYLSIVTFQPTFFRSPSAQNKKKIKTIQRLCFILYAGGKDRYAGSIDNLLANIVSVIKQDVGEGLIIMVFLAIKKVLKKLFVNIWPMLLNLLLKIFSQEHQSKPPTVLYSGLKLIQFLTLCQIQHFNQYKWIFLYDYVGIKVWGDIKREKQNQYMYKPCSIGYHSVSWNEEAHKKINKYIVLEKSFITSQQQVRDASISLCQKLIQHNQYKVPFKLPQIQQLIAKQFTQLDKFIFNIK